MFTRHFYEVDEVVAALQWCIKRGRLKEAVFWALEMIDTELEIDLYSLWLWHYGVGRLGALPLLQDNPLEVVCALTRLGKECRDASVLLLLHYGSLDTEQPDYILHPGAKKGSDLETAFVSALKQGKSRLAFDLSRSLWQDGVAKTYTLLQEVAQEKSIDLAECITILELQDSWPSRACAVAAVCLDTKRLKQSLQPLSLTLPADIQECIARWSDKKGRRERREFAIPQDCLYAITERGQRKNTVTTLEKLYSLSNETLEGSPFWNRVIEEEAPWLDDDRKEEFYEKYFPDDIPDEWSKADQEKSHGYGVLINDEEITNTKYIRRWYMDWNTRTYWSSRKDIERAGGLIDWDKEFEKPWKEIVSTWSLRPVKKQFQLL